MNVAVIGASDNPERYSYMAVKLLQEKGHQVFPVHKRIQDIDGVKVYASMSDIADPLDTVSLYVASDISSSLADDIFKKNPRRIIFNPGAENNDLTIQAKAKGIMPVNGCTLVMLKTGQF